MLLLNKLLFVETTLMVKNVESLQANDTSSIRCYGLSMFEIRVHRNYFGNYRDERSNSFLKQRVCYIPISKRRNLGSNNSTVLQIMGRQNIIVIGVVHPLNFEYVYAIRISASIACKFKAIENNLFLTRNGSDMAI